MASLTQQGFQVFKTGTLYNVWKRDNPGEAAKVDNCLVTGVPSLVASYTGRGLMKFAQGRDGFPEFFQGTLYKKWAKANPGENSKLIAYRNWGGTKPSLATATGKGLIYFVSAYKTKLPDPLWQKDIVYIGNLTGFEHTRRAAARAAGFSVLSILADGAVDPDGYRNLAELQNIRNSLLNEGWTLTGWATTDDVPENSAQRAVEIMDTHDLKGWIANGESWWENERAGEGPRWLSTYQSLTSRPVALSCLSSDNPNWARAFVYGPWINASASIQPQVYGNAYPAYTVYNAIRTMMNGGVPESLLNLTFGVYPAGYPIPWADYKTWKGPRSIYLGERLDAADYANLAR